MVKNGIDGIDGYDKLFLGKRVGLITSVTGLNSEFITTIDILHKKYNLTALFSPEHGVRGDMDAGMSVDTYVDPYVNVPVYSLYGGGGTRLTEEMLEVVDVIVYDIQDVGSRYYTYLYTMLYAMEECAKAGKEFVVLDRINPLGDKVEGNILKDGFKSFVGGYPLAMRYGLTIGEFAKMANFQNNINVKLHIVPIKGWDRTMLFPQTGRCWVPPSLGIPKFETALLYTGLCLFEGTNLSEGRGTTSPFETIGAPFIDAQKLSAEMNKKRLNGVAFTPSYFVPTASKFKDEKCQGVRINITDNSQLSSVTVGVTLLLEIMNQYSDKAHFLPPVREGGRQFIELLSGDDIFTKQNLKLPEILQKFEYESHDFAAMKREFQLY